MQDSIHEPLAIILIILMLFLLIVIGILANVLLGAVTWFRQKEKEVEEKQKSSGTAAVVTLVAGVLLSAISAQAQDGEPVVKAATSIGGLAPSAFYFMIGVLAVELLVIFVMLLQLRLLIAKQKAKRAEAVESQTVGATIKKLWNKWNKFRPVEQEADLDLGHEYDGIRELNNRLPPWWLYGFYFTIIFGVVYLWRYHVSESAPLSAQEFEISMRRAEEQRQAYLKKSASNVDENTVTYLSDASALGAGKKAFDQNCSPCHGNVGEGNVVGPNLTDDYWLHGGSISDVFKSIKYGWPEKGMRAWKDDLTPVQIAQIASYIKSLRGTNPPNAKEKQGELYQEEAAGAASDTTKPAESQ